VTTQRDASLERLHFELAVHRRAGVRRWDRPRRAAPSAPTQAPVTVASPPATSQRLFSLVGSGVGAAGSTAGSASGDATPESRLAALAKIAEEIGACTRCKLCEQRTKVVPGEGSLDPPILFIGEGPGADEDRTGRPFVGRAGQLLDKMIGAIGLPRGAVFIANIVKCRPPENRTPEPDEVAACMPFLERQIAALRPKLICTLGLPATRALLPEVRAISAVRGRLFECGGVPLVPTFHPAYLLRNPAAKHEAWEDLQLVARTVGLPIGKSATA
jgi:DNA polymerase